MGILRAAAVAVAVFAVALVAVSGGTRSDPRTPAGLPGEPAPFLGVAVVESGGRTEALDAYGNVIDLRRRPAGPAEVSVSHARQLAGTVRPKEAVVARAHLADGRAPPLWRADSVRQSYLPGTNVLRTVARFGGERVVLVRPGGWRGVAAAQRAWLARAAPLGEGAPGWARRLYRRSLLVLRALTDRRSGAVAAGARDGWAYVWPRDAATAALAFAAAGYRGEARRIARFLTGLDLDAAARFHGDGSPVAGRAAQGDAGGWVAAAARAAGVPWDPASGDAPGWRDRADYQEGAAEDYLGNALAGAYALRGPPVDRQAPHRQVEPPAQPRAPAVGREFGSPDGLARVAGEPSSGLDTAAAWAVRPFSLPSLYPAARRTLLRLAAEAGRYGLRPSQSWKGGEDPWTAPTAWVAWSLAALGERRAALRLMGALRRASTPLGLLPERVDADTGTPVSTTPLPWSHAFAVLALHELWPGGRAVPIGPI